MKYSLFILCCFPLFVLAQERAVLIEGQITNDTDIEGINILNITAFTATITNKEGEFKIKAKLNDTLIISSVQYIAKKIPVTKELLEVKKININLNIKVNQLDEVVVKPHSLSGDLSRDLKSIKTVEEDINPRKLGLPNAFVKPKTQTERRLYEATTGGGILPLNPIINAITGRTKRIKNRLKWEREERKLAAVIEQIDTDIYAEFLKIDREKFYDFIHYCAIDKKFEAVHQADDPLLMLEYLKRKSAEYNKTNNTD